MSAEEAAAQFEGVDVAGIANCVRDNATEDELIIMAAGGDASNTLTNEILQRASTQQCIADNNIVLPGASG